jgi:hypothetical protein
MDWKESGCVDKFSEGVSFDDTRQMHNMAPEQSTVSTITHFGSV